MVSERFRLTRPLIAIRNMEGKSSCAMIPENAILVVTGLHDGERLLQVQWEQEEMLVFLEDLRERSTPLPVERPRSAAGADATEEANAPPKALV